MPNTQWGNQILTVQFFDPADANLLDRRLVGILPVGIYSGGHAVAINGGTGQVTISPLVCEVNDGTYQVRVQTVTNVVIGLAAGTPWLVVRWTYAADALNWAQFVAVASPAANDVAVGYGVFSAGTLVGFIYTNNTANPIQGNANRTEPALAQYMLMPELTEAGESTPMKVRVRSGSLVLGDRTIFPATQSSPVFGTGPNGMPGSTKRIDLLYINQNTCALQIDDSGVESANPVPPAYNGRVVIAEVTLQAGQTSLTAASLADVRPWFTPGAAVVTGSGLQGNGTVGSPLRVTPGSVVGSARAVDGTYQLISSKMNFANAPSLPGGQNITALGVPYTPRAGGNTLEVEVLINFGTLSGDAGGLLAGLFVGSETSPRQAAAVSIRAAEGGGQVRLKYFFVPGSTSILVFSVVLWAQGLPGPNTNMGYNSCDSNGATPNTLGGTMKSYVQVVERAA